MRCALCLFLALTVSAIAGAQEVKSLDPRVSVILARMKARNLSEREIAFRDLMSLISEEAHSGRSGQSDLIAVFCTQHPDQADRVKLALITLLNFEDEVFIKGKPASLTEGDGEYYAELIDTVSSLDDERAIPALLGAMTTGGMAQRGILKYGDKALEPVLKQFKSSDALARASALGMATAILEEKNDPAAHALALSMLRASLKDPGPVVRRHAVRQIDCLAERQDFVPVLEEIAKTDPDKLPGRASDGGDGGQFYPVRADARRALRHSQNNEPCTAP